ncbi:unnamed protein product [Auanema sp. JU1783]|nr:unnamed protein product [Auanema sp. JU1783]
MILLFLILNLIIAIKSRLPDHTYIPTSDCQFEVHKDGPDGVLVEGAEIDMQLYYKIQCKPVDGYCLKVSNCTVSPDSSSHEASYPIIDSEGCSLEKSLYEDVQYTDDFTAGIVNPFPIRFRSSSSAVIFYCATSLQPRDSKFGKCSHPKCS